MGKNSSIQWTDHTWNPWHGCIKVSDGCKFCYMYRNKERYGQDPTTVIRSSKSTFEKPIHYSEKALVFTCSWSDFFIESADQWRQEAWDIIKATPHLTYQILTKRPERILECLPSDWGVGYDNVWLGVSVENQLRLDERAPILRTIPASVRFLSAEPLLGPISMSAESLEGIHWAIIGGESGNENGDYKYRPCELDWFLQIIKDCDAVEIPIFVKQLGTYLAKENGMKDRHGGDPTEFLNTFLMRQEFPQSHKSERV